MNMNTILPIHVEALRTIKVPPNVAVVFIQSVDLFALTPFARTSSAGGGGTVSVSLTDVTLCRPIYTVPLRRITPEGADKEIELKFKYPGVAHLLSDLFAPNPPPHAVVIDFEATTVFRDQRGMLCFCSRIQATREVYDDLVELLCRLGWKEFVCEGGPPKHSWRHSAFGIHEMDEKEWKA